MHKYLLSIQNRALIQQALFGETSKSVVLKPSLQLLSSEHKFYFYRQSKSSLLGTEPLGEILELILSPQANQHMENWYH